MLLMKVWGWAHLGVSMMKATMVGKPDANASVMMAPEADQVKISICPGVSTIMYFRGESRGFSQRLITWLKSTENGTPLFSNESICNCRRLCCMLLWCEESGRCTWKLSVRVWVQVCMSCMSSITRQNANLSTCPFSIQECEAGQQMGDIMHIQCM